MLAHMARTQAADNENGRAVVRSCAVGITVWLNTLSLTADVS
jgi:hypothetical protein